jgi:hypothetical protein
MVYGVDADRSDDSTQSSGTLPDMTATTLEARDFSPSLSLDGSDPSSRTNQRKYTGSKSSSRARTNPELGDSNTHTTKSEQERFG